MKLNVDLCGLLKAETVGGRTLGMLITLKIWTEHLPALWT